MSAGRIVEIGTPQAIYRTPQAQSTAEFWGLPIWWTAVLSQSPRDYAPSETVLSGTNQGKDGKRRPGRDRVALCLRPEDVHLNDWGPINYWRNDRADPPRRLHGRDDRLCSSISARRGFRFRVQVPGVTTWSVGDLVSIALPGTAAVIRRDGAAVARRRPGSRA